MFYYDWFIGLMLCGCVVAWWLGVLQFVVWYCCALCDFVYCMILRCVCLVVLCVTGFCLLVLTCGCYLVWVGVFCSGLDDVWCWNIVV